MSSQELIVLLTENYVEEQTKSLEVLFNPTISEKAKQLTLLQTKTNRRKRKQVIFIASGRKSVRYCGEMCVKIFIDVEAQIT